MLFDINQSGKFGTHFFIQFSDLFGQCVGLLSVFLLNSLDELLTQIVDFSLVATNDADEPLLTWRHSAADVPAPGWALSNRV
jgi:hypothetical protein